MGAASVPLLIIEAASLEVFVVAVSDLLLLLADVARNRAAEAKRSSRWNNSMVQCGPWKMGGDISASHNACQEKLAKS